MDWSDRIDFRPRAKVPIINFHHLNSVECDVSIGLAAKDTSELVRGLKESTGPALFVLSSFLKVFLNQLDLDKPFTGGLGSFKLYLMIATHIRQFFPQELPAKQTAQKKAAAPNFGEMLLSFLKFYGNPVNLNETTEIAIESTSVSFSTTRLATEIQKSFMIAYHVLIRAYRIRREILEEKRQAAEQQLAEQNRISDSVQPLSWGSWKNERPKATTRQTPPAPAPPVGDGNDFSLSLLGTVLDTARLARERRAHRRQCEAYPYRSPDERSSVAAGILAFLLRRLEIQSLSPDSVLSLERVEQLNPLVALRLRSFVSIERATKVIGAHLQTQLAQTAAPTNSNDEGSAALSGKKRKEYVSNSYGIVGNQIQAVLPMGGQAKVGKARKTKRQRTSLPSHGGREDDWIEVSSSEEWLCDESDLEEDARHPIDLTVTEELESPQAKKERLRSKMLKLAPKFKPLS